MRSVQYIVVSHLTRRNTAICVITVWPEVLLLVHESMVERSFYFVKRLIQMRVKNKESRVAGGLEMRSMNNHGQ